MTVQSIGLWRLKQMKTSYLSPTAWLSEAWRDGLGNRFWIDTRLLSVNVKCPDPGVASHDQKPDSGDSLRHQIPSPCPHSPPPTPHGIYIDRCIIPLEILNELSKASSTRIRKFVKTQFFLRIRLASTRIQRIFLPHPEIFEKALQSGNFFIRYEYLYVWTVVAGNLRIRFRHSLGSSLHGEHYKQTWRTARL